MIDFLFLKFSIFLTFFSRRYVVCVRFFFFRVFIQRQWKTRFFDLNEIDSFFVKNVSMLHQILDKECHYCVSLRRRLFRLSSMRKFECCLWRNERILFNFTSKFINHDKSIRVSRKLFIKLSTKSRRRSSLTLVFRNSSHDDVRCFFLRKIMKQYERKKSNKKNDVRTIRT